MSFFDQEQARRVLRRFFPKTRLETDLLKKAGYRNPGEDSPFRPVDTTPRPQATKESNVTEPNPWR